MADRKLWKLPPPWRYAIIRLLTVAADHLSTMLKSGQLGHNTISLLQTSNFSGRRSLGFRRAEGSGEDLCVFGDERSENGAMVFRILTM
jgi:hypothetical protein